MTYTDSSDSEKTAPILLRGLDLKKDDGIYRFSEALYEGSIPERDSEAMIGKNLAEKWGVSAGDRVSVVLPSGSTTEFVISGIYDLKVAAVNLSWVVTTLASLQDFFGYGEGVTSVGMKLPDPFTADTAAASLALKLSDTSLTITDWKSQNEQLLSGLNGQSVSSIMIQVFVLISVILGIASVLAITVMQKSRQVGILKAMGLIDGAPVVAITIDYSFIAFSALIAVAASVLASLIPARKSSKLNPIEVIRNG